MSQAAAFGNVTTTRTEDVLACAEAFALGRAVTPHQRRLMETALHGLRSDLDEQAVHPFVEVPLLVYAGVRGDEAPAVPLAAITTLLFLGIDIFDDVADGDLPGHWAPYRPAEINLAAATLLCALPQLALAELNAPLATLAAMQQALARGLLVMSAGQERDLASAGSAHARVQDVEASVAAKSGEEVAMFATMAAQFAGADRDIVSAYAALGRAIGTAGQLASDCHDLFDAPESRDLANGTRTLPIVLHLDRETSFLDLLEKARNDPAARDEVRRHLRASGALRHCAFVVEVYCQRALEALEEARPLEPARSGLRLVIDRLSFFPKHTRC